jgi:cbb3-type cytochrome oxidase subunit 3
MTMHDFEAKHWIIAMIIVLIAVGAFAYSWS